MADLGRTAFVSGGSSGIGYAIAARLLEDGYRVTISSRRASRLADAAGKLAALGEVHHFAADFADAEQVHAAIEDHERRFGRLDVLVNNAGVGIAGPIEQVKPKELDRQLDVNLRGYLLATATAVPLLRRSTRPQIINIASIAGIRGEGGLVAYSAAKAGVVGASEALDKELGPEGIKVTAVCPTFVDTPMAEWAKESVGAENLISVSDVVELVSTLLEFSPACNVPIVAMEPPGGQRTWDAKLAIKLAAELADDGRGPS